MSAAEHLRALSRRVRRHRLLELHDQVARQHAEATFIGLTSTPDFLDGSVPDEVLGARYDGAIDDLLNEGRRALARNGVKDVATRLHNKARLLHAFYQRFHEVTATPRGGQA